MRRTIPLALAVLVACDKEPAGDTAQEPADTEASGQAVYQDAERKPDGSDQEPNRPDLQPDDDPMFVEIVVSGSHELDLGEVECESLDGSFEGLYTGEATLDDDGIYVASMSSTEASFDLPEGCAPPDLGVSTLTEVLVRASLSATTQNCDGYCEAKARSSAEAACEGDSDEASCRTETEASYEASCTRSCASETHTLVAETALSASALTSLNAAGLTGQALGSLDVDLTFDTIRDADGDTVAEE